MCLGVCLHRSERLYCLQNKKAHTWAQPRTPVISTILKYTKVVARFWKKLKKYREISVWFKFRVNFFVREMKSKLRGLVWSQRPESYWQPSLVWELRKPRCVLLTGCWCSIPSTVLVPTLFGSPLHSPSLTAGRGVAVFFSFSLLFSGFPPAVLFSYFRSVLTLYICYC